MEVGGKERELRDFRPHVEWGVKVRAAGAWNYFMRLGTRGAGETRQDHLWHLRGKYEAWRLCRNERSSCAAAQLLPCCQGILFSAWDSLTTNSMEFRTGLEKGLIKLEYGSVKKVEVPASTFCQNSSVLEWFFLHHVQSLYFCYNFSSQPSGNFQSFRFVEAATSTFSLWMGQYFYFPVSLSCGGDW